MERLKVISAGFSLIEILVTVILMGIVAVTATGLFTYALRSNQKTRAILEAKQVGDNAIVAMANKIRQADTEPAICGSTTSSNTITIVIDDVSTTFTCSEGSGITLNGNNLIGIGTDLKINNAGCFICYADSLGGPAVVEISFTLTKGSGDNPQRDVSLDFMTSVSLRAH